MKNYFSRSTEPVKNTFDSAPLPKSNSSNSNLANIVEQTTSQQDRGSPQPHPALRLKGLESDFSHKPLSNVDEQLEEDLSKLLPI